MENLKENLNRLIEEKRGSLALFKRNIAKEYLQVVVLDFIYSSKNYGHLIFYGGSCLKHCYGLPRLSEDLDFVDLEKKVDLKKLANDLEVYFKKNTDIEVRAVPQKFRVYLKFPILRELGLANASESDLLFLKVEVFGGFGFCKNFKTEIAPLFKYNRSILIKTFDLSTLMATKIRAVFSRKWEKTGENGRVLASVKGRDYFDLMWYLEKKIKPNFACIEGVKSAADLKNKLTETIQKIDERSVLLDLEPLIEDKNFLDNLSKNLKEILKNQINAM
jgi:predicted nucleotidyltransferase component of viral defense system